MVQCFGGVSCYGNESACGVVYIHSEKKVFFLFNFQRFDLIMLTSPDVAPRVTSDYEWEGKQKS